MYYENLQNLEGIAPGYNPTPATITRGALPGFYGPDIAPWNALLKRNMPRQPRNAGYGAITKDQVDLRIIDDIYMIV